MTNSVNPQSFSLTTVDQKQNAELIPDQLFGNCIQLSDNQRFTVTKLNKNACSISIWVKRVSDGSAMALDFPFAWSIDNSGALLLGKELTGQVIATNQWTHLGLIVSGDSVSLYLNGTLCHQTVSEDSILEGDLAYISKGSVCLAHQHIYERALSPVDIQVDYHSCTPTIKQSFTQVQPLNFSIINPDDGPFSGYPDNKLFIVDAVGKNTIEQRLVVQNSNESDLILSLSKKEQVSENNHHFELRLRNGTISQVADVLRFDEVENWLISQPIQNPDDRSWSIFFLSCIERTLSSEEVLIFSFKYRTADGALGERGTHINLSYRQITRAGGGAVRGDRNVQVDILNLSSNNVYIQKMNEKATEADRKVDELEQALKNLHADLDEAKERAESAEATASQSHEAAKTLVKSAKEAEGHATEAVVAATREKAEAVAANQAAQEVLKTFEKEKSEAIAAQKAVETARLESEKEKKEAEEAKRAALVAQQNAETEKAEAVAAKEAAEAAKAQAEKEKNEAEKAHSLAEIARQAAEDAKLLAENEKDEAVAAEQRSAAAAVAAEEAKALAIAAEQHANSQNVDSNNALAAAQEARNKANEAQRLADEAKQAAVKERLEAKAAHSSAITKQTEAAKALEKAKAEQLEASRALSKYKQIELKAASELQEAKKAQIDAEQKQKLAQSELLAAQKALTKAEQTQRAFLTEKQEALDAQRVAQQAKREAESEKKEAVEAKVAADNARLAAITARDRAEDARSRADSSRKEAEKAKQDVIELRDNIDKKQTESLAAIDAEIDARFELKVNSEKGELFEANVYATENVSNSKTLTNLGITDNVTVGRAADVLFDLRNQSKKKLRFVKDNSNWGVEIFIPVGTRPWHLIQNASNISGLFSPYVNESIFGSFTKNSYSSQYVIYRWEPPIDKSYNGESTEGQSKTEYSKELLPGSVLRLGLNDLIPNSHSGTVPIKISVIGLDGYPTLEYTVNLLKVTKDIDQFVGGGNVGIGTGSNQPIEKLEVRGNVKSTGRYTDATGYVMPEGGIIMWHGSASSIPSGWVLCDGNNGTPNLQGRFVVGHGYKNGYRYNVGSTGGYERVRLSNSEMPVHTHPASDRGHSHPVNDPGHNHTVSYFRTSSTDVDDDSLPIYARNTSSSRTTSRDRTNISLRTGYSSISVSTAGGGGSHENRPPYYVVCFIMKK